MLGLRRSEVENLQLTIDMTSWQAVQQDDHHIETAENCQRA